MLSTPLKLKPRSDSGLFFVLGCCGGKGELLILGEQKKKEREMASERVFYLFEIEEYEKYSGFTYEKIMEDYILIERFVYEEGSKRGGIWGITEAEKWKLMNVITAKNLFWALFNLFFYAVGTVEDLFEKEWIESAINEEKPEWQKISTIPLYRLLQLNKAEEPLLVIMRIKTMAKKYLDSDYLDDLVLDELQIDLNISYCEQILKILGIEEPQHYPKFYEIFKTRSLQARWEYRDAEKEKERKRTWEKYYGDDDDDE